MNEQIKQKWVEALRSGKYKQGFLQLRKHNYFCCLGVLCDLYAETFGEDWKECGTVLGYSFDGERVVLPKSVQDWAELKTNNGEFNGERNTLTELNDEGTSFEKIADIIEKEF